MFFALDVQAGAARWLARFGAGATVVPLTLYGVLQAVDGIGNKQVDLAWVSATGAEKGGRFASAEAMRWLEWGVRSYLDYALGVALLLLAAAAMRTAWLARPIAVLIGLSGLAYLVQGAVIAAMASRKRMTP